MINNETASMKTIFRNFMNFILVPIMIDMLFNAEARGLSSEATL